MGDGNTELSAKKGSDVSLYREASMQTDDVRCWRADRSGLKSFISARPKSENPRERGFITRVKINAKKSYSLNLDRTLAPGFRLATRVKYRFGSLEVPSKPSTLSDSVVNDVTSKTDFSLEKKSAVKTRYLSHKGHLADVKRTSSRDQCTRSNVKVKLASGCCSCRQAVLIAQLQAEQVAGLLQKLKQMSEKMPTHTA